MECPVCDRQLKEMEISDIVVDVCENGCGGIWFDNYELKKVDEKHESAGEKLLEIARDPNVKVDHTEQRSCPKCTYVLAPFEEMHGRFKRFKLGYCNDRSSAGS